MNIGERVFARIDGKIQECIVEKICGDVLHLQSLETDTRAIRAFWEIRKIDKDSFR